MNGFCVCVRLVNDTFYRNWEHVSFWDYAIELGHLKIINTHSRTLAHLRAHTHKYTQNKSNQIKWIEMCVNNRILKILISSVLFLSLCLSFFPEYSDNNRNDNDDEIKAIITCIFTLNSSGNITITVHCRVIFFSFSRIFRPIKNVTPSLFFTCLG